MPTIFIFLLLPLKLAILTIILFLIFIYFNLKKDKINYFPDSFRKTLKDHWPKWLTISILSAIAYSIIITQLSLVFNVLNLTINKSIITILKDMNIKIAIRKIRKNELNSADEVFLSGTAAEITPIIKINKRKIGTGKVGNITKLLMSTYSNIVMNKNKKYSKWLTRVY